MSSEAGQKQRSVTPSVGVGFSSHCRETDESGASRVEAIRVGSCAQAVTPGHSLFREGQRDEPHREKKAWFVSNCGCFTVNGCVQAAHVFGFSSLRAVVRLLRVVSGFSRLLFFVPFACPFALFFSLFAPFFFVVCRRPCVLSEPHPTPSHPPPQHRHH